MSVPEMGDNWIYQAQVVAYVDPPAHRSGAETGVGAVFAGGAAGAGVAAGALGAGVRVGMTASGVAVASGVAAGECEVLAGAPRWWTGGRVVWCEVVEDAGELGLREVPCRAPARAASMCAGMYMKVKIPMMTPAAIAKTRLMILLLPLPSNRAACE